MTQEESRYLVGLIFIDLILMQLPQYMGGSRAGIVCLLHSTTELSLGWNTFIYLGS